LVDAMARMNLVPPENLSVEQAREQFRRSRVSFVAQPQEVASAKDSSIPGPGGRLRIRTYRPQGSRSGELLPGLIYFHGGGWVFGDLDSHDPGCRELCNLARCTVVSVDYRLAPEHKFPAAAEDAIAATRWIAANAAKLGIDPNRLAVGGDSAGGNLAAVVAIDARDHGGPRLTHQFLIYPATDMRMDWPSAERHAKQLPLTKAAMDWFIAHYLRNDADKADWRASPLRAASLKGLPPALIITAGFDPLCDEGEAYAKALRAAGVSVTYEPFGGQIHGFLTMGRIVADSERVIGMGAAALRQSFAAS